MLNPAELIKDVSFTEARSGYDKKEVDTFVSEVSQIINQLLQDNVEIKEKYEGAETSLEHYKAIEKTMQKALILAEKTAEDTRTNAEEVARQIENEAVTKAQVMLREANRDLDIIRQQIIVASQEYESFKIKVKNMAAAQMELFNTDVFNLSEISTKWINTTLEREREYNIPAGFQERKNRSDKKASDGFVIVEGE